MAELPHLKSAIEPFKDDDRLVVLSLSLDDAKEAPAKFVSANGMTWSQGFLGNWNNDKVTKAYGVRGIPSMWLIGPDGRVIQKGFRGEQTREVLEKALKR